jgi:uncharacterized protein
MSETNVEIVKKIYEVGGKGDMAGMMAHLAPNVVVHEANGLPYGGVYHGHAGMGALFQKLVGILDNFRVVPEDFFVSGSVVVAKIRVLGRARATGQTIDMPVLEMWTLDNGLVTEIRPFYWDTAEFQKAAGGA